MKSRRLKTTYNKTPSRVIKLHNGNWFGLCYLCGAHQHSLTWKTAFFRAHEHIKNAHTYTLEA